MPTTRARWTTIGLGAGWKKCCQGGRVAIDSQASGALVMDAALAAIALEHGATLATTDRDFARFEGLNWVNPLQA